MKIVQINKVRVNLFDEDDLINKLGMTNIEKNLVLEYQMTFPELLQDDIEGFVIDGETLWNELGNPQGKYADWFKRKIKDIFKENLDYSIDSQSCETKTKLGKRRVSVKRKIMFTLEAAKGISMATGMDKKSSDEVRNKGKLVRDYFILMEKTLRNYKEWSSIRGNEKDNYKEMYSELVLWIQRKKFDVIDIKYFSIRECNMINEALTGMKANEIRSYINAKDKITRDHLDTRYNKVINELQELNTSLLMSDLDFKFRKSIIETTCKNKYSDLYILNKIKTA